MHIFIISSLKWKSLLVLPATSKSIAVFLHNLITFNPTALKKAKIVNDFGASQCK